MSKTTIIKPSIDSMAMVIRREQMSEIVAYETVKSSLSIVYYSYAYVLE